MADPRAERQLNLYSERLFSKRGSRTKNHMVQDPGTVFREGVAKFECFAGRGALVPASTLFGEMLLYKLRLCLERRSCTTFDSAWRDALVPALTRVQVRYHEEV